MQGVIAAIAFATLQGNFSRYAHQSGISKHKSFRRFNDFNRGAIRVIGVHQAINQCLAQSLMNQRVITTHIVPDRKRYFEIDFKLANNTVIKIQ